MTGMAHCRHADLSQCEWNERKPTAVRPWVFGKLCLLTSVGSGSTDIEGAGVCECKLHLYTWREDGLGGRGRKTTPREDPAGAHRFAEFGEAWGQRVCGRERQVFKVHQGRPPHPPKTPAATNLSQHRLPTPPNATKPLQQFIRERR